MHDSHIRHSGPDYMAQKTRGVDKTTVGQERLSTKKVQELGKQPYQQSSGLARGHGLGDTALP